MVLKVQIALVNKYPCKLAPLAVLHHPVLDGFQRHHQGRGPQLLPHLVEVKDNKPVIHVDVGGVGEHIQAALGDQLGGEGNLPRLRVGLLQHFLPPVGEQGHTDFALPVEIVLIDIGGTAVNDGFVAGAHAPRAHLLLQNAGDDLRLHGNGVFVVGVAAGKIKGGNMVLAVGGDFDNLAAQSLGQRAVLALGVNNNHIVAGAQHNLGNGVLHSHALAGAGDAQIKAVGGNEPLAVTNQKVAGNGVNAVGQPAGVLYLLHPVGHKDGGALGGQRPQGLDAPEAVGQDGVQPVLLLVAQNGKLA